MRTAALLSLLLIGVPLAAAPVPKAKPKTFEDRLLGTWKYTGDSYTEVYEFTADGEFIYTHRFNGVPQPSIGGGKVTVIEAAEVGKPTRVVLKYTTGTRAKYEWEVRDVTDDALKVQYTDGGSKKDLVRIKEGK